jgi:hypothetical protein
MVQIHIRGEVNSMELCWRYCRQHRIVSEVMVMVWNHIGGDIDL